MNSPPVLYEDNHLLAVNKPAALPTMGVAKGQPTVLTLAKAYIKQKYNKPGNVYLGVVSRLDAPVTGVLLIARTSKAAARLSRQFRDRQVSKVYLAVVEGVPEQSEAVLEHLLRKDERHRRVHVTMVDDGTAQQARLRYRVLRSWQQDRALVEVHLETGRKHQIRAQFAAIGHPVAGDRKYNSNLSFAPGIALHSSRLEFTHPVRGERMTIEAELPGSWRKLTGDR